MLDRVQSGTHDRCISQSSICIVTSCKTMLIYPVTKCMYCCYDPTTQSNGLGPIWYLQPKLGFRRNSFMSLRPARPACLARVLRGQLTKFTRNNPGDSQSQCKLKAQRVSPARTDLSLVNTCHRFTCRSWTLMRKYYSKHLSKTVGTHHNQLEMITKIIHKTS